MKEDSPEPVNSSVCTKLTGVRIAGGQASLSTGRVAHRRPIGRAPDDDGSERLMSLRPEQLAYFGALGALAAFEIMLRTRDREVIR
jgi:hypothetical protein